MGRITLEGLEFFAFHGYYDEEQKIGNKYGVDITVETTLEKAQTDDKLSETIDYEELYLSDHRRRVGGRARLPGHPPFGQRGQRGLDYRRAARAL